MSENTYTIDASGKRVGRVATEAAAVLAGKTTTAYVRNQITGSPVEITNASKLSVSEAKREGTTYTRYSGYPGGLKVDTMEDVIKKHGYAEVLRRAVYGMLPSNKLRAKMMKRLTISE